MMWRGLAVAAALTLVGVAPAGAQSRLIGEALAGRLDVCADKRLEALRFSDVTGAKALREEAAAAAKAAVGEPQLVLGGLQDTLDALLAAQSRTDFRKARRAADARVKGWTRQAIAANAAGYAGRAGVARVWSRARGEIAALWREGRILEAGVLDCRHAPRHAAAQAALAPALEALILEEGRLPVDALDGPGAARQAFIALTAREGLVARPAFVQAVAQRAEAGELHPGLAALIGSFDKAPPADAAAFAAQVVKDWEALEAYLATWSPAANVGERLHRMTLVDQFGRRHVVRLSQAGAERSIAEPVWRLVIASDAANTAAVRALLAERDWFDDSIDGEGAAENSWLIVQHSDQAPEFQSEVLKRFQPLLGSDRVRPEHFAQLWDRVAVAEKRRQRYGTQLTCTQCPCEATGGVDEPEALDPRRAVMGLEPWEAYRARFADQCGR